MAEAETSEGGNKSDGCLWGGTGEKTTYLGPFCPLEAPDIPIVPKKDETDLAETGYPLSPENAISSVTSEGKRFSYYFREGIGYRKISEFRTVFEPKTEYRTVEVDEWDSCGQLVRRQVTESSTTPFPVLHEKEFIRYEPIKVLTPVIIPGDSVSGESGGVQGLGSATIRFSGNK